jgi:16S rRNA processing protein RimM
MTESAMAPGSSLRFGDGPEAGVRTVTLARPHGREWIVTFDGLGSRGEAEAARGSVLYMDGARLPEPEAGSYYRFQLVGLRVRTSAGLNLGRIEEILETGAHDVCVVRGERGEILIPAVDAFIAGVDLAEGEMIVNPIPGLVPEVAEIPGDGQLTSRNSKEDR